MPILPLRYIPSSLTPSDKQKQTSQLMKSRKAYRNKTYITRKKVSSFVSKPSPHVQHARALYHIDSIRPSRALSRKTGCSVFSLQQIVRKGEGAYFSAGSRPNQTAQSWGIARLASAITGGKAAAVDFSILEKGCTPTGRAFRLALSSRKKHGHGRRHRARIIV